MASEALALHLATSINITACRKALDKELIVGDRDELFYSDASRYLYIFRYGVVSFFGYSEPEIAQLLKEIEPYCEEWRPSDINETMEMELVSDRENATIENEKVLLPKSNVEGIRFALLHLSQSVALDYYAGLSEQAMKETREHTTYLEENGKLDIGGKKLKRHIAKVLNINNQISENLYIFDSHEVVWEDLELDRLDKGLKQIFDLKERYRNIKEQGHVIKENLSLFMNIMDHRESSRLEWIIIILILVEVVDLFIMRLIS